MRRFKLFFFGLSVISNHISQAQSETKEAYKECIVKYEKKHGIEPGLLEAIVQIESKFIPYAVNACGRANRFNSATEAAKFVQDKQKQGYQNISVGIAQLHVPSHGSKFPNHEKMLCVEDNLACAAKLLKRLKQQTGSWESAVKRYHSPDPEASELYRGKVFGAWAKIRKVRSKGVKKRNHALKVAYKTSQEAKNSSAQMYLLRHLQSLKTSGKQTKKGSEKKQTPANLNRNYYDPAYIACINCGADALLSHHTNTLEQCRKVHDIVQTVQ